MILVTGATGFIGQHLVKQLVDQRHQVACLIRPSHRERSFAPGISLRVVIGDLSDLPALRMALQHVTHVVHLAGIWDETDRDTFESANIQGTRNVIDAMKEVSVKRLITISSVGADTHSAYPYLRIKAQVDDIIEASGLDYTILESSAVYGPRDGWTELIALALRRFPLFFPIPGDGGARLQPLFVDDLVRCILACLTNDKTVGKTYTVGGPQQLTYDDLVSIIMQITRHARRKRYLHPSSALRWSKFIRSFIDGQLLYTETQIDLLSIDRTTDQDAVSFHFGFTPARPANALGYLL